MPHFIVEQPEVPSTTVPIGNAETSFGRSEENNVVLVADEVSRHHAKVVVRDGSCILLDLGSLNGTYVNRQRVKERVLTHMDEVWFGSKCRLIFWNDSDMTRDKDATSESDSALQRDMARIRQEVEDVGSSMTRIGQRTKKQTETTGKAHVSDDDVVKMGRAYRRLAALYRTSQVMASGFDLHTRLAQLLDVVIDVMEAERGFIMLRDHATDLLSVKVARKMGHELEASSPSMGIAGRAAIDGEPVLMADRDTDREFGMRESIIRNRIRSAMCVPLKIENRVLGSIYIDTTQSVATFDEEELELFSSLASQSAMAIDHVRLHEQVVDEEKKRQNLGRFLSPAIVDKIINEGSGLELGGRKQQVTTLFADIRGSSLLAEQLMPYELVGLLNEHFTNMTEIVFQYRGTLDKYIGDELMAVFGSPIASSDDPVRAIQCALAMQARNAKLNETRMKNSQQTLHIGIGIETGEAIAGYIGSPQRMEFTVVGDRVNTAKRLCDIAGPGKVVVGEAAWEHISNTAKGHPIGTVTLRGKEVPVCAHEVTALTI